jgi:hypothetical protein
MNLPRRWKLVIAHAILVGGLLLVGLVSELLAGDQDRNVVGAAAVLTLIALGLPWTASTATAHHLHHSNAALVALFMIGPALLNVAIGALIAYGQGARRRRTTRRALTDVPAHGDRP